MIDGSEPPPGVSVWLHRTSSDDDPAPVETRHIPLPTITVGSLTIRFQVVQLTVCGLTISLAYHQGWAIEHPLEIEGRAIRMWPRHRDEPADISSLPLVAARDTCWLRGPRLVFTPGRYDPSSLPPMSPHIDGLLLCCKESRPCSRDRSSRVGDFPGVARRAESMEGTDTDHAPSRYGPRVQRSGSAVPLTATANSPPPHPKVTVHRRDGENLVDTVGRDPRKHAGSGRQRIPPRSLGCQLLERPVPLSGRHGAVRVVDTPSELHGFSHTFRLFDPARQCPKKRRQCPGGGLEPPDPPPAGGPKGACIGKTAPRSLRGTAPRRFGRPSAGVRSPRTRRA